MSHITCICTQPTGHTNLISALRDEHVKSGFTTQLILELLKRSDTRTEHFVYVLTKMPIISVIVPHFEGSKVEISALLKKRISDVDVFKVLFKCGMIVQSGDFYIAKEMQQKRTLDPAVYRLIMTKKDSAPQVRRNDRQCFIMAVWRNVCSHVDIERNIVDRNYEYYLILKYYSLPTLSQNKKKSSLVGNIE